MLGRPAGPSVFPAPCRVEPELHVALRRPPGEELGEVLEDDPPIASFPAIAWPATRIFARVGRKKPARRLSSVVLPQPDWPSTQTDSEAPTVKLTSWSAVIRRSPAAYSWVTWRTSIRLIGA
jgi:hypothetical protein